MPKKLGLPLERHAEIGAALQAIRDKLTSIKVELSRVYPLKFAGVAGKALNYTDELRSILDDKVAEENPTLEGVGDIYYRGRNAKSGGL